MKLDIKNFIEQAIPELRDTIFPIFTCKVDGLSIVYNITQQTGGHVKESQLELKIIHSDYDYCLGIEEKLLEVLDMEEDSSYTTHKDCILHSSVAGGGCLFNEGYRMYENTLYFIIKWR